jgi:acyl-CoA dehydrogenase
MWSFETDPDYQADLDWADAFVRDEIEPLEFIIPHVLDTADPVRRELIPPLQAKVRERGLWATHLGPELGGQGHGQVKLGLLNEILGRSPISSIIFGCQAPDTGNAEILAHYGTEEHKQRYLQPLLDGEIFSTYSMTEPQAGSDPKEFTCRAELDGDEWVINGEKWFSSNARWASFLIAMVITEPENPPYQRHSMIIVPSDTPGVNIIRNVGIAGWDLPGEGGHAYIRYDNARVPAANLLGGRGGGFVVAQTRLGGGRIHHAMRTVGMAKRALEMMLERAVSRRTQGELLSRKQLVQEMVADSWLELEQFRLLVLQTAWKIDRYHDYKRVRGDIAAVKVAMPTVLHHIASRALQVHGSLGLSDEMPFMKMIVNAYHVGLADGPTEVHKITLARGLLSNAQPSAGLFPTNHIPLLREQALDKYADVLARHGRAPHHVDDGCSRS